MTAAPTEPRTILVHLNVQVPHDDRRTADQIAEDILSSMLRSRIRPLIVTAPLAEEV